MLKAFKQYDNDLVEKPVVWFQAALDFTAWVGFFKETNRNVSKIHNRGRWLIIDEGSQSAKAPRCSAITIFTEGQNGEESETAVVLYEQKALFES